MNLLDRFGDWLERHTRTEDRIAWLLLMGGAVYVGGHVAVRIF